MPREKTVKTRLVRRGGLTAEDLAGRLYGDIHSVRFTCAEVTPAAQLLQHAVTAKQKRRLRTHRRARVCVDADEGCGGSNMLLPFVCFCV